MARQVTWRGWARRRRGDQTAGGAIVVGLSLAGDRPTAELLRTGHARGRMRRVRDEEPTPVACLRNDSSGVLVSRWQAARRSTPPTTSALSSTRSPCCRCGASTSTTTRSSSTTPTCPSPTNRLVETSASEAGVWESPAGHQSRLENGQAHTKAQKVSPSTPTIGRGTRPRADFCALGGDDGKRGG